MFIGNHMRDYNINVPQEILKPAVSEILKTAFISQNWENALVESAWLSCSNLPDSNIDGYLPKSGRNDNLATLCQKTVYLAESATKMIIWQSLPEETLFCKILAEKMDILQDSNKRERVSTGWAAFQLVNII